MSRERSLTFVGLLVLATVIALANLSSEVVTFDLIIDVFYRGKPAEHALGWPLAWYWRPVVIIPYQVPAAEYGRPHLSVWRNLEAPWKMHSPVSRYRFSRLAANVGIWLVMLAGTWAACRWLLAWCRPIRLRLRLTTLVVFAIVSALTVLANLSHDARPEGWPTQECSYGWPWIWYRYFDAPHMTGLARYWDYSAIRLAGNLAIWLTMLAVTGFTWQWLLDHYRPRLRWSLRSMLAAIAIGSAICAWFAVLRDRAAKQDALLDSVANGSHVYFERWGPKWLDFFGADRYRRRIVAAEMDTSQQNDEFFERLARLRSVKLLDINPLNVDEPIVFTDRMAASLGEMRQLRVLVVDCSGDKRRETKTAIRKCLTAIGKLNKLERLSLTMWEDDVHELARLAGLANLKTLSLEVFNDDSGETKRAEVARALSALPPLPRLESLDLEWEIGDEVLGRLAGLPRVRSLNLSITSVTDVGLAKLVPLDSLEELAINKDIATATAFKSLAALKNLRALHIGGLAGTRIESVEDELARRAEFVFADAPNVEQLRPTALVLDDGHELPVLSGELDDLDSSLVELRRSHPRIVIDADYRGFMERIDRLQPRWYDRWAIDSDMRRLLNLR